MLVTATLRNHSGAVNSTDLGVLQRQFARGVLDSQAEIDAELKIDPGQIELAKENDPVSSKVSLAGIYADQWQARAWTSRQSC